MSVLNVISQNMTHDQLVVRHEVEDFNAKSQLIVDQSQEAIFYKNGQALDLFGPGPHPLNSENVPLIKKLLGALFGKTPFPCHVYFINKITVLTVLWGTRAPFTVEDPVYQIPVTIGANGQTGVRIVDSRKFVEKIVGTVPVCTTDDVKRAIKGKILMLLNDCIASAIKTQGLSMLDLSGHYAEIADELVQKINERVASLGIELDDFSVDEISPSEDDLDTLRTIRREDLAERTKIRRQSMERRTITDDTAYKYDTLHTNYQQARQFDILEGAARNESSAGGFINMGVGMGVGVGMSRQMSEMTSNMQNNAMGGGVGAPVGNAPAAGMKKCTACGGDIPAAAKFCPLCGQPQAPQQKFCPNCGTQCAGDSKFCGNCGNPLA